MKWNIVLVLNKRKKNKKRKSLNKNYSKKPKKAKSFNFEVPKILLSSNIHLFSEQKFLVKQGEEAWNIIKTSLN